MNIDEDKGAAGSSDERLGIQSVEVASEILSAVVSGGGLMTLKDISAGTNMHRAKVHRYLTSLTRTGLLMQDDRGLYGIGSLALSLGLTALRRLDPVRIAFDEIPKLTEQLKESVIVAIWSDTGPTVVALQESPWPITLNVRAGSTLPLTTSATGMVFEAYLPQRVLDNFKSRQRNAGITTVTDDRTIAEVRENGMARANESLLPGINALAAPVFDHIGQLKIVIGVVGRKETLDTDWYGEPAKILRHFVAELGRKIGQNDL